VSKWVVLLHVLVAFWFVAGLVGRGLTIQKARSSADIGIVEAFLQLAGRFEQLMVIPGSAAVLVLGLLAAWSQHRPFTGSGNWWLLTSLLLFAGLTALVPTVFLPRGRVFEAALEDAKRRGGVTAELRTAFRDPAVAAARWTETVVVAFVILLMVTKPF
jgi:Predicted integral membrane protein (DUF2269)